MESICGYEILIGPSGKRSWPDSVKSRLVAESFVPGVTVNEVARRAGLRPNHLSAWRRLAREGRLVVPDLEEAEFVPIVLDPCSASTEESYELRPVEIIHSNTTIRLDGSISSTRIAEIVRALGSSS